MSRGAAKRWMRMAPMMERLGLLTEADADVFSRYCDLWEMYDELKATIKGNKGKYYKLPNGTLGKHPAVEMMFKTEQALTRMEDRFGLTPSARCGLNVTTTKADDDFEEDITARKVVA